MPNLTKQQLEYELNYYFKKTNPNVTKLNICGESEDDDKTFLKIKKPNIPGELYTIKINIQDKLEKDINDECLQENINELTLIYNTIKKANQAKAEKPKQIFSYILSINIGLLAGAVMALGVFTGFFGAIAVGAGIGLIVAKAAAVVISSVIGAFLTRKITKPRTRKAAVLSDFDNEDGPEKSFNYTELPRTWGQFFKLPFTLASAGLKWVARKVILDNFLSKYLIGTIIAGIANMGNPHYKIKAKTIAQTLGPLIFQGGLAEPQLSQDGTIELGPMLSKQWLELTKFKNEFIQDGGSYIFEKDESQIKFDPFKVKLNKKTILSGITAGNNQVNAENKTNHLHLIYFNGNSGTYHEESKRIAQDLLEYEKDGKAVTSIQYNYPGVVDSTGKVRHAEDLVQSGIAQVERLRAMGVEYKDIGLHGVSLGGSIASHVAGYYHSRGIHLAGTYASSTFSSTCNVGVSYVKKVPIVGPVLGILLYPLIYFGVWGSRWNLDTAKEYAKLPLNEREHSIVRSAKEHRRDYQPKDDPVLVHLASLHNSWRLKLQRFFHKHGLFGYDKNTYAATRRGHKMSVFNRDVSNELHFDPDVCGHSDAHFNYGEMGSLLLHRGVGADDEIATVFDEKHDNGAAVAKKVINYGQEAGSRVRTFFNTPKEQRHSNNSKLESVARHAIAMCA